MPEMDSQVHLITIRAPRIEKLRQLAARHRLDLCFGSIHKEKAGFSMDAYLPIAQADSLLKELQSQGVKAELKGIQEEEIAEVSTTNRYASGAVPRGVGQKR